jgi:colanic acid biosynthesis glycosyl transferase WcaI
MKILVWGINYAPEVSGIGPCNTALCEYLAQRGHEVTMLTAFAFFPEWRKRPGDTFTAWRSEATNGVKVVRVWEYVPSVPGRLRRVLHEASFAVSSFLCGLGLGGFDVVVVISPPIGLGFFAWLLSGLKGAPFVFHAQELQPDEDLSSGARRPGLFTNLLRRLEALAYARAARVSGVSKAMLAAFRRKNVPEEKILSFPNGVTLQPRESFPAPGAFLKKHGLGPDYCLATCIGRISVKQGLEIFSEVAPKLVDHAIKIVICSSEPQIVDRKLKNLLLLPVQDALAYREMLVDTSIRLIAQQTGTGRYAFPRELLSALVYGKAVLAVTDRDSELAEAIAEAQCGRVVAPGDVEGLAAALIEMSSPARQFDMARSGKKWVEQYGFDLVHARFEEQLTQLVSAHE